MPLTEKQKELVEMLKDPEIRKELEGTSGELDELMKEIEITDTDDIESLNKKHQERLTKVVKHFEKRITNAESSAVEKATADTRKKEDAKIAEFAADNPGMKNPDVVAMMQPLYDKGKSLEECYAAATRGLGLDPKTGEVPKDETPEEKTARLATEKEAKETEGNRTSARSTITDDPAGDPEEKGEEKPVSLDDALANASADFIAKHGNPFEEKKE